MVTDGRPAVSRRDGVSFDEHPAEQASINNTNKIAKTGDSFFIVTCFILYKKNIGISMEGYNPIEGIITRYLAFHDTIL
jgi:hypothetical protein